MHESLCASHPVHRLHLLARTQTAVLRMNMLRWKKHTSYSAHIVPTAVPRNLAAMQSHRSAGMACTALQSGTRSRHGTRRLRMTHMPRTHRHWSDDHSCRSSHGPDAKYVPG
jgi:hypothetical protein